MCSVGRGGSFEGRRGGRARRRDFGFFRFCFFYEKIDFFTRKFVFGEGAGEKWTNLFIKIIKVVGLFFTSFTSKVLHAELSFSSFFFGLLLKPKYFYTKS